MFLCTTAVTVFAGCLENSKSVVPESYLKVMKTADSVSFVMIDPWVEDAKDWMDGYGEVLSKVTLKDQGIIQSAYELLSAPKSFEIRDVVKNCTHMPDVVIIFHSKNLPRPKRPPTARPRWVSFSFSARVPSFTVEPFHFIS